MDGLTLQQKKVVDALACYTRAKQLKLGDKLPPVKAISEEFNIGHVTVARTIKYLSEKGYVATQKKVGTVLLKNFGDSPPTLTRVVILSGIREDTCAWEEVFLNIRKGVYSVVSDLEIVTLWTFPEDDETSLNNMLVSNYMFHKNKDRTVFLLLACPAWVKRYFQVNQLPCVIMGGIVSDVHLPIVTVDTKYTIEELFRVLDAEQAYPAVYCVKSDPMGEHHFYYKWFQRKLRDSEPLAQRCEILRMSESPEVFKSQFIQLFQRHTNRPRTLILPGEFYACKILRFCGEMGIKVPEDVRIICLESNRLCEQLVPSIAGFYLGIFESGEKIGEMVKAIITGDNLQDVTVGIQPIFVYRESFPKNKPDDIAPVAILTQKK
jgi:DNA-binding LacI/PurR family transcriptional regulator